MKSFRIASVVIFSLLLMLTPLSVKSEELMVFDLSNGKVRMKVSQHNPVIVKIKDSTDSELKALFETETFSNEVQVNGKEVDFNQKTLVGGFTREVVIENGRVSFSSNTELGKKITLVKADKMELHQELETRGSSYRTKQVNTLVTAKGKSGKLFVNYSEPELAGISLQEELESKLKLERRKAESLIKEYGANQVKNALRSVTSKSLASSSGASIEEIANGEVAGGAGGIMGYGGVLSTEKLDSYSTFKLYLNGTPYKGSIEDSVLSLRFYYPGKDIEINDLGISITVAGPIDSEKKDSRNVVLIDALPFYKKSGTYRYSFKDANWMDSEKNLKPGPYKLFIDVSPAVSAEMSITISESGEVFSGSY